MFAANVSGTTFEPKTKTPPTPERTWTLTGGASLLGKIEEINGETIALAEVGAETGEPTELALTQLSDRDREILEQFLSGTVSGKVIGIVDGDTLDILTNAKRKVRIRLHGIDAPERGQAFSNKSKDELGTLTFGQDVRIIIADKDRDDRLVGIIYNSAGENVNLAMVEAGLAWHYAKYLESDEFAVAEMEARKAKAGLWLEPGPVAPWDHRSRGKPSRPVEVAKAEGKKIRLQETHFVTLWRSSAEPEARFQRLAPRILKTGDASWKSVMKAERPLNHWLNLPKGTRHNRDCRWFENTKNGRLCGPFDGEACGQCGG